MFTYINLYAVFCYMAADVVLMIINDIIRLSIFETRPFWDDNKKVFPCVCEFTPSSPSPISTKSFLFFSLFIFVQYEEKLKNKEINRMIPVETKKLSDTGYNIPNYSLEKGIDDYVQEYLMKGKVY